MYYRAHVSTFRRGLLFLLGLIVVAVALWVVMWLAFFSHSATKTTPSHGADISQSQGAVGGTQPSPGASGTASPTAPPPQLVNTGAGNTVVLFAATSLIGAVLHYTHLRRKVLLR